MNHTQCMSTRSCDRVVIPGLFSTSFNPCNSCYPAERYHLLLNIPSSCSPSDILTLFTSYPRHLSAPITHNFPLIVVAHGQSVSGQRPTIPFQTVTYSRPLSYHPRLPMRSLISGRAIVCVDLPLQPSYNCKRQCQIYVK